VNVEHVDGGERAIRVVLGEADVALLVNALNEVCNGLEIADVEFATRLGVERSAARALLAELGAVLDAGQS
jgi:hypothetical protein